MESAILSKARWRSDGVESRQSTNASEAALRALSTSAAFELGAVANSLPVEGLMREVVSPDDESTSFPFTKFCSFFIFTPASLMHALTDHRDHVDGLCNYRANPLPSSFRALSALPT